MKPPEMPLLMKGLKLADGHSGLLLKQGTITVLMGPNGAGKTRLLEAASGLRSIQDGTFSFGQESVWITKRKRNRAAMLAYSYAAQAPEEQFFGHTAEDEFRFVLKPYNLSAKEEEQCMDDALTAVGWERSLLGRSPYHMSGGERRRLALACVFAPPACWILMDEPTAGLDAAGHTLLAQKLKASVADGQGVLLASHESEWVMELADSILLLGCDGVIRRCTRYELLAHPEWLEQAGMAIPAWLVVARRMWECGVPSNKVWKPAELAHEVGRLDIKYMEQDVIELPVSVEQDYMLLEGNHDSILHDGRWKHGNLPKSWLAAYDPRSVLLSYMLLSTGIFIQTKWSGLMWSCLLTIAVMVACGVSVNRWRKPIAAISFFYLSLSILGGINTWGDRPIWQMEAFLISLQSLSRPWLVMLIGFSMPMAVTPLQLRRSIDQLVNFRGRIPSWWQNLSLTIALILRFVPVLVAEWERFSRIAIARGKETGRSWHGAPGRLLNRTIPFLLALFRKGEEVSNALESRGVGKPHHVAALLTRRWRREDTVLLMGSFTIFMFLCWWS